MTIEEYIESRKAGLNERMKKYQKLQNTPGKSLETWKQMTEVLVYTNETLRGVLDRLRIVAPVEVRAAMSKEPKKMIAIPKHPSIH